MQNFEESAIKSVTGYLPKLILCVIGDDGFRQKAEPILRNAKIDHEWRRKRDEPRFRLQWEECTGYEADDSLCNPFGRWRFAEVAR